MALNTPNNENIIPQDTASVDTMENVHYRHRLIGLRALERHIRRYCNRHTGHNTPVWAVGEVIDRGIVLINKSMLLKAMSITEED